MPVAAAASRARDVLRLACRRRASRLSRVFALRATASARYRLARRAGATRLSFPRCESNETVKLADLATHAGVSSFHLQRTFKRVMGISPRQYLAARRFGNFKTLVREGEPVTQALYDSGFNSSSRLYEHAPSELGMTPATYGRGGRGINISYTIVASPMGRLLVAVTERGVCAVRMGDTDAELEKDLRGSFRRQRSNATMLLYVSRSRRS